MLIDWFTVGAQIVNFLVLMALLKIFLYDRVIRAMDRREQRIAERLEDADRKRREADEAHAAAEKEKRSLEEKREQLLKDAREAARAKQQELEEDARAEVSTLKQNWHEALEKEKERLARDLEKQTVRQALAVARRVIEAMAGDDFQDRLVSTFAERIRGMARDQKDDLAESLDAENPTATVLSDNEVTTAQRQKITRLLHKEIHPDLDVDYRADGDLLGGIELRVPGKKVSWSPRQYLEDLEEDLLGVFSATARKAPAEEGASEQEAEESHEG